MTTETDALALLAETAQRLLKDHSTNTRRKSLLETPGAFDFELWRQAVDLGWPAVATPAAAGGLGWPGLCSLAEAMGRVTTSLPLVAVAVAAALMSPGQAGSTERDDLLAGRRIATLSLSEPGELAISSAPRARFRDGKLYGTRAAAAFAAVADFALVHACDDGGVALYLVDLHQPQVTREIPEVIDNARAMGALQFDGATAIRVGEGWDQVLRCLAIAALVTAFEQLGGAQTMLSIGCKFAGERRVFGQPIGRFQAIKHRLADVYTKVELARGCALDALDALNAARRDFDAFAAAARLAATDAYDFATREVLQIHGGIGVTWEAEPHHHYRRARSLALELGGAAFWRDFLVDNLALAGERALTATESIPDNLAGYADQVRVWLAEHAPRFSADARRGLADADDLVLGRAWQRFKADAGYGAISFPQAYGGGGASDLHRAIFLEEEGRYDLPTAYFAVSLAMPVPMLLRYGDPQTLQRLVPPAIRGEQIWCQLFSEPAAGSDLAALRMTARRQGDYWVLDGQKLWTSWAQYSDWGVIVVRTDSAATKHAGLSYFYLDMHTPGITVCPVRRLAGRSDINAVLFDAVVVPDSQRMGAVGDGFRIAVETLMIERFSIGDESCGGFSLEQFIALAARARIRGRSALDDSEVRRVIADAAVELRGLRAIHHRAMAAISAGKKPGPEGSIRKLLLGQRRQQLSSLALDLLGADGVRLTAMGSARSDPAWSWIEAPIARIAGGTDEILRNTIAEKILGLPQDHRPDKRVPFNQIE